MCLAILCRPITRPAFTPISAADSGALVRSDTPRASLVNFASVAASSRSRFRRRFSANSGL